MNGELFRDNNVPNKWIYTSIEYIAEEDKGSIRIGPFGSNLKKSELVDSGLKVYGQENVISGDYGIGNRFITELKFDSLSNYELKPGDFLITMMGTIGKTGILPEYAEKGIMDSHLIRIRLNENIINPNFFKYTFASHYIQRQIMRSSRGAIMKGLNSRIIRKVQVPIPPLNEQHRIVAKIEELFTKLDAGAEYLKQSKMKLEQYRQALLEEAFSKYGIEGEEWSTKKLSELIENSLIGIVRRRDHQNNNHDGVAYLKMNNIETKGRLDLSKMVYVEASDEEIDKYSLRNGDILINTRNSYELVGKNAVFINWKEPIIFNNNILRIRLKDDANPFFVSYQMQCSNFRKHLLQNKRATTNICALYQKDILNSPIRIPSLDNQTRIVERIDTQIPKIEYLKRIIEQSMISLDKTKQAILKKAFKGGLVPQDPSDEPADVLLKRIQEERNRDVYSQRRLKDYGK
ncbi:MAG: restriction endonuclease subunit S [Candidatus Thorarchaeota archaeon]